MTPDAIQTTCQLCFGLFFATAAFLAGAHFMYRDEGSCADRLTVIAPSLLGAATGITFIICCGKLVFTLLTGTPAEAG